VIPSIAEHGFDATRLETARLVLRTARPEEAAAVVDYFVRNEAHLASWEPARPPGFYTEALWRERLEGYRDEQLAGRAYRFHLFAREQPRHVIGTLGLTNVVRGPFLCAQLGFGLDARCQGRGLMVEAVEAAVGFAFDELGLHRVEANHQPQNLRSAAVLRRARFEIQGYARDYLFIDGAWRDHVLTARTSSCA
jgi:ribosomal-protein-alanine N-acetyltransferase